MYRERRAPVPLSTSVCWARPAGRATGRPRLRLLRLHALPRQGEGHQLHGLARAQGMERSRQKGEAQEPRIGCVLPSD